VKRDPQIAATVKEIFELIKNPADFAGSAIEQSQMVANEIRKIMKGQISKVELQNLI